MMGFLLLAVLDLGALFAQKDAWNEKAPFFAVEHAKEGFVFASENRDIVNSLKSDTCTWHGLQVWETKVYFDAADAGGGIARVEMSLYNRGDALQNAIDESELQVKIDAVTQRLAPGGRKAPPVEKTTLRNGGQQFRRVFEKADPAAELVWGLSADRTVEYLRLTLSRAGLTTGKTSSKRPKGAAGKAKVKDNVTKSPNGDVFIDNVPMVDQGQKGYCAAAVSERVLRYYGNRIDEHEIAQQAGTSAEGGTSVAAMKEAVSAIGEKNGLGFQNIVDMTASFGDIEEEIERYNKAAKSLKRPTLALATFMQGNRVNVGDIREAMEPKVLYKMRLKDSRFKKFSQGVRQQVNAGVPVFWGVTLGIFPERGVNPQSSGGHMRLIIGYNDKKKEILYTDTWGEGHELKRMPEDWAFAITHDAFFLKPR